MASRYDVIVVGSGTAATVAATRLQAAGKQLAIIDFRPFGGTCALRGCDPKKILVGAAGALDHVWRMQDKGIDSGARINWPELIGFKRGFTDPIPQKKEQSYAGMGIDTYHGRARFTGTNTLQVNGDTLEADSIVIAAGAEPVRLGMPGEEHLITNEDFLTMESLPESMVLVGGGYIAAEFSHVAARAGAKVTVLQRGKRMLKHFDPELVDWLMPSFERIGVEVKTETQVESVEKIGEGYRVTASQGEQKITLEAECVVHAAGRKPALQTLDLAAANVAEDKGRIRLNEYLQSVSNPAIYAAGDAAQMGPPLTPVASHDAKIVASNLLEGNRHKPDYRGVPSVAFTIPPIASVGLSEADAREQQLDVTVKSQLAADWFTARQTAEPIYGFKTLVDKQSDRVLGAHLVGPHADEVINLFSFAIRQQMTATALTSTMFAYPTAASDISSML
jgi:glutathione reductase (NADPH)